MSELCSVPRVSERFAQSNALDEDIARLKYVSGKREEALRRLGIRTVGDLLLHIPHRYLDFTRSWSIEMAPIGTVCTIIATVDRIVQKQPRPRMQVTEVSLVDETGVLQVAFFRQPWIAQQLKQGDRLAVMGKVEFAYGFKQMASPHFEKLEEGRAAGTILPVHYVSDGVSQAWMRRIVSGALEVVGNPFDPIPARLRVKRRLMSNARALRSIHFPSSMAERDIARCTACLRGVPLPAAGAAPAQRRQPGRCGALRPRRGRAPGRAQASPAVFAERRAGGRVPRYPARYVRWRARDEPPAAGRCRYRQDRCCRLRAGCGCR